MKRPAVPGLSALVFDFDGTLAVPTLDFAHMRREALRTLAAFGFAPQDPRRPVMEILEGLEDAHGREAMAPVRAAVLATVRRIEIEAARESSLFPYVRPMLDACRDQGLQTAIVTRNCPEAVRAVFPDVDEHMACLVTRDDVARVKPDPEQLLFALERMGRGPEGVLMAGDHPMDILVGKRVGTMTAGVAGGESGYEELRAAEPDYLAHDGGELMRALGIL